MVKVGGDQRSWAGSGSIRGFVAKGSIAVAQKDHNGICVACGCSDCEVQNTVMVKVPNRDRKRLVVRNNAASGFELRQCTGAQA
jgi:hypothetical protein